MWMGCLVSGGEAEGYVKGERGEGCGGGGRTSFCCSPSGALCVERDAQSLVRGAARRRGTSALIRGVVHLCLQCVVERLVFRQERFELLNALRLDGVGCSSRGLLVRFLRVARLNDPWVNNSQEYKGGVYQQRFQPFDFACGQEHSLFSTSDFVLQRTDLRLHLLDHFQNLVFPSLGLQVRSSRRELDGL
jgi:hypothetical protein